MFPSSGEHSFLLLEGSDGRCSSLSPAGDCTGSKLGLSLGECGCLLPPSTLRV